jgi:hypothetical protein
MSDPYTAAGYDSRDAYLEELADAAGEDSWKVYVLADLLGPEEDFEGLVTHLEDEGLL